jgi:hypothetical protein
MEKARHLPGLHFLEGNPAAAGAFLQRRSHRRPSGERLQSAVRELFAMHLGKYLANGALAATFALNACAATPAPPVAGSAQTMPFAGSRTVGAHYVILHPVRIPKDRCPASRFAFCIVISDDPGGGPYWYWCGDKSCSNNVFAVVATSSITITKTGKSVDRELPSYFDPKPGNPSNSYIFEHRPVEPSEYPKFTQTSSYCYYFYPSVCDGPIAVGLIPQ